MDYSDDFYDYFNIDPVDIQSPTLSRLGMPGLSKPALTSGSTGADCQEDKLEDMDMFLDNS